MKTLLSLLILLSIQSACFAQFLEVDKKDDFTGDIIKRTSYELVNMSSAFTCYTSVSDVNGRRSLSLKMMIPDGSTGAVVTINEGNELMLKLENGEVVKLECTKGQVSCIGCGSKGLIGSAGYGTKTSYQISEEQYQVLLKSKVQKVRIYLSDSYVENDIKKKPADKFSKALLLIK